MQVGQASSWLTIDIQSTFDAYSAFCSSNAPNDYERRLVAATQASQPAKQLMSERRYGKTRQDFEDSLVRSRRIALIQAATDFAGKGIIFNEYISWETDQRAKTPNEALTRAV